MKSWKKTALVVGVVVVVIVLVIVGISWSKRGTVVVQTGKVNREDLASVVTASGQIKPPQEDLANVNAETMGKITEIYVKEGDLVKKGQVLLRTDDVQQAASAEAQEAALKTAMADLDGNEAAVQSADAALKTAEASVAQTEAQYKQASDDYARGQESLKQDLIARQAFDQLLSAYKVAEANVQSAKARVVQAQAQSRQAVYQRDMAKARIAQSKAQLAASKDLMSKTVYTSPLDGIVTSLPVHVGENVVPGIQNQVGSVLFQVSDLAVITAEVMVDESDIVNVKLGQSAEISIDAIPNKTFKGKVTEIGQSAVSETTGQTTTQTSTATTNEQAKDFKVVVTLDEPPPGLRPGLSATSKVTTANRKDAVSIPIQALTVRTRGELEQSGKNPSGQALAAEKQPKSAADKAKAKEEVQGVFVVREGKAVFVPVETGIMGATDVEIVSGLKVGDTIVTGSYQVLRTLKNNTKVRIDNTPAGPAPASS